MKIPEKFGFWSGRERLTRLVATGLRVRRGSLGTGLGLAVVRGVVERRGSIQTFVIEKMTVSG
jgi:hypothetical protein